MSWKQLVCHTNLTHKDVISDLFEAASAASITYQDAADQPVLEPLPGETPFWDDLIMAALFPLDEDIDWLLLELAANKEEWQLHSVQIETLEDQEWVRAWMDNFHPMQFGEHLWIYPSWHDVPEGPGVKVLLDPGLAFGTGNHPTTALCLEWLGQFPSLAGKTVLDYGCGSGILAIAAAKLGAKTIWATDIDPQALQATLANAARNDIPAEVIQTCYPQDLPQQTFDLVLANILAGPLVQLAPEIVKFVRSGGELVLSGILATQTEMIRQAYESSLSAPLDVVTQEEWIRAAGKRS